MITIFDRQNAAVLNVDVDDKSYRYRALKGEDSLTLYFALAVYVEIPMGAYVLYQNQRYQLMTPSALRMIHTRNYEYTLTLYAASKKLESFMFRDMDDQRLSFSYTAKPHEHLDMLIRNMNARLGEDVWTAGECIEADQRVVNYDYMTCAEALEAMANEFDTEWEIDGNVISLHKVEYNRQNPLALGYGRGKGFRSGVGRSGKSLPVEILCVQTTDRNIYFADYRAKTLMLPPAGSILRYDGSEFVTEGGRPYVVCPDRYSIKRSDKSHMTYSEAYMDATEIYPTKEHKIKSVDADNPLKFAALSFDDDAEYGIPDSLNYGECRVDGEVMTIVFQSGELAGREFDIKQNEKGLTGYDHASRGFTIIANDDDDEGAAVPNATIKPAVGDKFKVFHCALPEAFICDNETKTGASWEVFKAAAKKLYDEEEQKYTFTGELDPIWASQNWYRINGSYLRLGGYIRFTDERFQPDPIDVRIVGIKDFVNYPHAPQIELSNEEVASHVASVIKQIGSDAEVSVRDTERKAMSYSKRRWSDAMESMAMLQNAIEGYDGNINPASVHSLMMLVGDESLQFRFENTSGASSDPIFDTTGGKFSVKAADSSHIIILHHLTLGVKTITSEATGEYRFTMSELPAVTLDEPSKAFYLYAVCSKSQLTGSFELSPTPYEMYDGNDTYHFLVGTLSSEHEDGDRSFQTLYGFTEISGGRILTDVIRSADGKSFFNLENGSFNLNDMMMYNINGDGVLMIDGASVQRMVLAQEGNIENLVAGKLRTAVSGKRVEIYDNELTMYDSNNNMKLKVSGEPIDTAGAAKTAQLAGLNVRQIELESRTFEDESVLSQFTIDGGNAIVTIPQMTLTAECSADVFTDPLIERAIVEAWLKVDGNPVAYVIADSSKQLMRSNTMSDYADATYSRSGSMAKGTHTISVKYKITMSNNVGMGEQMGLVKVENAANVVSIDYASELVTIGSNGFSATFGTASNKAEFIRDANGSISLTLVVNGKGIRITEAGVQKNTGGSWVNL